MHSFNYVSNHDSTHITPQRRLPYCKYEPHGHYPKWHIDTTYLPLCTKTQPNSTATSHIIAKYVSRDKYASQMPYICHICQLFTMYMGDICVSIYTSYQLTPINNVTRSTGIHTFHIISRCPRKYVPATLHIYVPLHFYCSLHIYPHITAYIHQISIHCNIYLPYY